MSVVIFINLFIEAAKTLATGLLYYRLFTIGLFCFLNFLTNLIISAFFFPALLPDFPTINLLLPASFIALALLLAVFCYCSLDINSYYFIGSVIGCFLLLAPYYQLFLPYRFCYQLFLVPATYYLPFLSYGLCY